MKATILLFSLLGFIGVNSFAVDDKFMQVKTGKLSWHYSLTENYPFIDGYIVEAWSMEDSAMKCESKQDKYYNGTYFKVISGPEKTEVDLFSDRNFLPGRKYFLRVYTYFDFKGFICDGKAIKIGDSVKCMGAPSAPICIQMPSSK